MFVCIHGVVFLSFISPYTSVCFSKPRPSFSSESFPGCQAHPTSVSSQALLCPGHHSLGNDSPLPSLCHLSRERQHRVAERPLGWVWSPQFQSPCGSSFLPPRQAPPLHLAASYVHWLQDSLCSLCKMRESKLNPTLPETHLLLGSEVDYSEVPEGLIVFIRPENTCWAYAVHIASCVHRAMYLVQTRGSKCQSWKGPQSASPIPLIYRWGNWGP